MVPDESYNTCFTIKQLSVQGEVFYRRPQAHPRCTRRLSHLRDTPPENEGPKGGEVDTVFTFLKYFDIH